MLYPRKQKKNNFKKNMNIQKVEWTFENKEKKKNKRFTDPK